MDNKVLRNLSYGVYVVTTKDNDKNVGCIANSIMQVTSNPSVVAVSINHDNYTNKCIKENNTFAVSILTENSNPKIIGEFGFKSSKDTNKFEGIDYKVEDHIPIINDSCGYFICKVINTRLRKVKVKFFSLNLYITPKFSRIHFYIKVFNVFIS